MKIPDTKRRAKTYNWWRKELVSKRHTESEKERERWYFRRRSKSLAEYREWSAIIDSSKGNTATYFSSDPVWRYFCLALVRYLSAANRRLHFCKQTELKPGCAVTHSNLCLSAARSCRTSSLLIDLRNLPALDRNNTRWCFVYCRPNWTQKW